MIKNNFKRKIKQTLVANLVLFFICSAGWATTYYVDDTDGSDAYNGLNANYQSGSVGPWRTIGKCASTISAGDTCIVEPGTYDENITESTNGSKGAEIVYQANGSGVVIDGDVTLSGDYIHLKGFEITNGGVRLNQASHCVIEDNYIHDTCSSSDVPITLVASTKYEDDSSCSYNTIRNNRIARGYDVGISTAGQYNTIEGNEIYGMCGGNRDGIHFHGGHQTIRGNYIHDNVHPAGSDPHIDCFQAWRTAHDTVFDKNICVNSDTSGSNQIVMLEEYADQDGDVRDLIWKNNIFDFSDPGYCPIRINQKNSGRAIENIIIINNTFIHRNVSGRGDEAISLIRVNGATIKNNIFYNFGSRYKNLIYKSSCDNIDIGYNNVYVDDGNSPTDGPYPNDVWMKDPKFVDWRTRDYHLRSDSPAIDAGYNSGVADDIDEVPRPQNGRYDIGAYEYHGGEAVPPEYSSPAPPQNLRIIN